MAQLALEDLVVTSFFPGSDSVQAIAEKACTDGWSGCGEKTYYKDCICTADISTCPRTTDPLYCVCTADISTCSRTSVEGGCDTSVQCVSVPCVG